MWDRKHMPPGVTKQHPTSGDVIARGQVTLLVAGQDEQYRAGWRAGRRELLDSIEGLAEDEPDGLTP